MKSSTQRAGVADLALIAPAKPGADELLPGVYRLFPSVTFDGGWEPYLRVIYRDLGPLLDTPFQQLQRLQAVLAASVRRVHPLGAPTRGARRHLLGRKPDDGDRPARPAQGGAPATRHPRPVARYIFGAHPSADVSRHGWLRGRALQAAVLAYLKTHEATLPNPLPQVSREIWQGSKHLGLEVVADTIGGVMLGFTPSVFGNYSNLMRAWIERGTDGARTLWDLQALLLQGPAAGLRHGAPAPAAGTDRADAPLPHPRHRVA